MNAFFKELQTQRWDDHRYYHHSHVNQSLHLVSALSFLAAYGFLIHGDPAVASLIAWLVAMTSRQAGHFFFEPRCYDQVNQATHEYKEEIKLGYNLQRKRVLLSIWALSPLVLFFSPTLFGLLPAAGGATTIVRGIGLIWFGLGAGGLFFRTIQLFFLKDIPTGLTWMAKILTDPFHDIKLYYKSPLYVLRGRGAADEATSHEVEAEAV